MNGRSQQVPPGLGHGLLSAVVPALKRWPRLLPLLLALTLAGASLPLPAAALSPPWRRSPQADIRTPSSGRVMPPLQEVSPPEAVQQIQTALATRQPVVEIVSPAADSLLPPGPWTLRLRVHDWPLVEGGPHLVVQLDQEPPRIWTSPEGVLPELSPGSHRLTVYAALPWGEARKNPGAMQQIRLHRSAPNPLTLPAPGSPQLLAVSPAGPAAQEPLLLDWLLLDAPLQDVGGSGTQWRLRVTINGDAVLLDQQSPLWLRGWRPGLNALSLELLDGRGEPLNPPFNSLVQEVDLSGRAEVPRWQGGLLSAAELAILLGESAPSLPPEAAPGPKPAPPAERHPAARGGRQTLPGPEAATAGSSSAEPQEPSAAQGESGADLRALAEAAASEQEPPPQASSKPQASAQVESSQQTTPQPAAADRLQARAQAAPMAPTTGSAAERIEAAPEPGAGPSETGGPAATDPPPLPTPAQGSEQTAPQARPSQPGADSGRAAEPAGERAATSEPGQPDASAAAADLAAAGMSASATGPAAPSPRPDPQASPDPPEPTMTAAAPAPRAAPQADPRPDEISSTPPQPQPASPLSGSDQPERVRPSSELNGRARDLVNDDGTLRRPERRGPLAGLRERLQR